MLFKSLTGIAKQALGSVSSFRKVLDFNPSLMAFALPPQVSLGIKVAGAIGSAVGWKVPNEQELKQMAQGKLDMILKGVRRDVLESIDRVKNQSLKELGTVEVILNKIEWLL